MANEKTLAYAIVRKALVGNRAHKRIVFVELSIVLTDRRDTTLSYSLKRLDTGINTPFWVS